MYLYRHEKRYFSVFISVAEAFSFIKLGGNNQMKKKYHEISLEIGRASCRERV